MASPSSYTIVTMTAAQQKAAAAAAARRKRRKVLRSQSPHRFQKRFKSSLPAPPQGGAKRPLTSSTILSTPTPKTTTTSSSLSRGTSSTTATTTTATTNRLFQPTVQGIHQVASQLSAGQVLALPTECTYEAVTQLSWNEPNDWAERIQPLYEVMMTTSTTNTTTSSLTQEEDEDDPCCDGLLTTSFKNNQNTDDNINHGSSSSSNGDSCWNNTNNDDTSSSLSSDTTCSHTRYHHRINRTNNTDPPPPPPPHIYLHMAALDMHPFWRKYLPKRPYAVGNKEGEVLAAHAFNETAAILRLLAAKMWPGPVVMHVAVAPNNNNHNVDALAGLTIQRNGKTYLALRSLCHPLMVKVYQEYLKKTSLMMTTSSPSTTTATTNTSTNSSSSGNSVPEDQPHSPPPPARDSSASSSNGGGGGRDSPLTPNGSKIRRLSLQQSQYLLVGTALAVEQEQKQTKQYVTTATQVPSGTMVLHGEERREIFAVPTCEYGCPSPISLWLDAAERCVVVVHHRRRSCQKDGDNDDSNDDSDNNKNNDSSTNNNHMQWTAQQLLQTLRMALLGLGKTGQDRVIQAVLSRWQVKEEEEEEVAETA